MNRLVVVAGIVALGAWSCGAYCKACVPITRVHLTSKAGASLTPSSVVIVDQTGSSSTYDCAASDGGVSNACNDDGVTSTASNGPMTITATAKSGERVSSSVSPTYTKLADGACGPCLSADVTVVLE